jgi:ABC-type Fe3+-siderophore transport system permease subunit
MAHHVPLPYARYTLARASFIAIGLLVLLLAASIMVGASGLPIYRSLAALLAWDRSADHALIFDVRLPRAVLAALVGSNLAVAGVLIQALTRNPLASPQTFGINAGAALAIVISLIAIPMLGRWGVVVPAFLGAALVGVVMWSLSLSGAVNTIKLALAGISIQLVLAALVQAILISNNASQDILFWLAGSVTSAQWAKVAVILPFTVIGISIAILGSRHFGLLALDTTTSLALGQNARLVGGGAAALMVVLAGSAVAVSGPIGFVGLIVPHLVRRVVGEDQRSIIVLSAIAGPLLLVSADLLGRLVFFPSEVPVGIVTALLGAPAFLFLVWRQSVR